MKGDFTVKNGRNVPGKTILTATFTLTSSGPPAWHPEWPGGRPIARWPRLDAGRSDEPGATPRERS